MGLLFPNFFYGLFPRWTMWKKSIPNTVNRQPGNQKKKKKGNRMSANKRIFKKDQQLRCRNKNLTRAFVFFYVFVFFIRFSWLKCIVGHNLSFITLHGMMHQVYYTHLQEEYTETYTRFYNGETGSSAHCTYSEWNTLSSFSRSQTLLFSPSLSWIIVIYFF